MFLTLKHYNMLSFQLVHKKKSEKVKTPVTQKESGLVKVKPAVIEQPKTYNKKLVPIILKKEQNKSLIEPKKEPNIPTGKEKMTANGSTKLSYCAASTKYTNMSTTMKIQRLFNNQLNKN